MVHAPSEKVGAAEEEMVELNEMIQMSHSDGTGRVNRCFMVLVLVLNVFILVGLVVSTTQRAETERSAAVSEAAGSEAAANKMNEFEAGITKASEAAANKMNEFEAGITKAMRGIHHDVKALSDLSEQKSSDLSEQKSRTDSYGHPEWLSKCREFFFDVGSNIGTHGRKMFEPSKYPDAPYLQIFNDNFGPETWRAELNSSRCYIGIEANPAHMARLKEVEVAYLSQGWKWHSYNFGAWYTDGTMTIQTEADPDHSNWGAHLDFAAANPAREVKKSESVRVIDLNDFVTDVIARAMPHAKIYLMKMDIEGAEWEVLHFMIKSGTFCSDIIAAMTIEAHNSGSRENWGGDGTNAEIDERVKNHAACGTRGGPTKLMFMDDESYLLDGQALP